jgi:hypothetical protein
MSREYITNYNIIKKYKEYSQSYKYNKRYNNYKNVKKINMKRETCQKSIDDIQISL